MQPTTAQPAAPDVSKASEVALGALERVTAPITRAISQALGWDAATISPLVGFVAKVALALLLLSLAWLVANWAKRMAQRVFARTNLDETLERFFANAIRWVVLVVGVIICLETFGVSATSLVAVLGTIGLAIGLALQGSLSHFASGVMLLIFRPFKVEDVVTVAGKEGKVDAIDLFTTTIDTPDNRRIIIPNGQIFGSVIENHTHHPHRLVSVRTSVAPGLDIDLVRRDLLSAASAAITATPGAVKNPAPSCAIIDTAAAAQVWAVNAWAAPASMDALRENLLIAIKEIVERDSLAVPAPVSLVKTVT
jgi:small conductance mechanosensitive channel